MQSSPSLPSPLSPQLVLESPEDIYHDKLCKAFSDTGNFSCGIAAIEAWVINDKKTRLIRPQGAWWCDPNYHPPPHLDEDKCRRSLKKLEDPKDEEYLKPEPLQPGLGLPGLLWAESYSHKRSIVRNNHNRVISDFGSFHGGVTSAPFSITSSYRKFMFSLRRFSKSPPTSLHIPSSSLSISGKSSSGLRFGDDEEAANALTWRSLNFISLDPDHIPDNRMTGFIEAGMAQVAGIPFDTPSSRGIILLYAKSDTDIIILNQKRNVDYLKRSAYFIASALDLADYLVPAWEAKQEENTVAKLAADMLDNSIKSINRSSNKSSNSNKNRNTRKNNNNKGSIAIKDFDDGDEQEDDCHDIENARNNVETNMSVRFEIDRERHQETIVSCKNEGLFKNNRLVQKLIMVKNKTFHVEKKYIKPPPPMPNSECIWTFVGSFITIFSLSFVSELVNSISWMTMSDHSGNGSAEEETYRFTLPLGPLGAFSTLMYGLASAPASQPRNAIYGSILSGCAGLITSYIPSTLMNLRLALALSLSNSWMAKFGVIHPPGGALSLILCMDDSYDWFSLLLYLLCVLIAIVLGTLINNLNEKRTYPQYWNMFTSCSY